MFILKECECAVCGETWDYAQIIPDGHTSISLDLDLWPGGTNDYVIYETWRQQCPFCGYVSESVSDPTEITKAWLLSKDHLLDCAAFRFISPFARRFYKSYLIEMAEKDFNGAFFSLLYAAWVCDDTGDATHARYCRELAIPLVTELLGFPDSRRKQFQLVRADMMRRVGQFEELVQILSTIRSKDQAMIQILEFQKQMAIRKSTDYFRTRHVKLYLQKNHNREQNEQSETDV